MRLVRSRVGLFVAGAVAAILVSCGPAAAPTALNWSADDATRIEVLKRTGEGHPPDG